jgi:hypothetical protein
MVTKRNAKRTSRLAAVGGVTGALALGVFGLAVSAHENTTRLSEPTTQAPAATATQTPAATATATQTPATTSTNTGAPQVPAATGVPGMAPSGMTPDGMTPDGMTPGAGSGR